MPVFKLEGLDEANNVIKKWFAQVQNDAERAAVGLARECFVKIIETGPQYSGDFVANINVSVGYPNPNFYPNAIDNPDMYEFEPFQEGDEPAISFAEGRYRLNHIDLGQHIFITSNAAHAEDYSIKIEENKILFRPANISKGATFSRSFNIVASEYATIDKGRLAKLKEVLF